MLKMSVLATFRGNFSSLLIPQSSYCPCDYRPRHILASSSVISWRKRCRTRDFKLYQVSEFCERREIIVCRAAETEIEPDNSNNDNKEKEVHEGGEEHPTIDSVGQTDDQPDSQPTILNQINGEEITTGGGTQEADDEVVSGSPLPGVKPQQLDESIRIPKETIDILRNQVFGFDTFFVTSQEPYEGGVLFKGNLRGLAAKSYEKLTNRMQNKLGDEYEIFLLVNPEDDKPVAVVVPRKTLQPETTAVPEWFAAGAFGLVTIFTLLLRNVPALQSNLLSTFDNPELLMDGLPGALVTALVLGAHELSHILVAKSNEVKLGLPYFVPSWQIGSFGAITRITSIVPKREVLLKVAVAGPLAGFSLGLVLFLLGFILPPRDGIGLVVDASVFHESFLAGVLEGTPISVNPLVIWAWAGLLINAINSIPAGELDGCQLASLVSPLSCLDYPHYLNDVAFYWVVLIFFLQRGPISPVSEEISDPENKYVALGLLVLVLGLLVCLPYPFPFTDETVTSLTNDVISSL
ncbi:zinc metalloprotease EGY2 [Populus alba x Populus x berolinensis]|nr:zinc metalloprotease EGY2 [Populus alba x Populus x berolinensis]